MDLTLTPLRPPTTNGSLPSPVDVRGGDDTAARAIRRQDGTARWKTLLTFVLGDLLAGLLLSLGAYGAAGGLLPERSWELFPTLVLLLPGLLLLFAFAGLYRERFCHPALEMPRVAGVTGLVGATAALTVVLGTGDGRLALLVAACGGLGMIVLPLGRACTRVLWARASWWGVSGVVIASGQGGDGILRTLDRWPEIGLRPLAVLTNRPAAEGEDESYSPIPQGPLALAPRLAQQFGVSYAIVSGSALSETDRAGLLLQYAKFFDHVLVVPDDPTVAAFWATGQSGDGLIGYSMRHASLRPWAQFLKRAVDVLGALAAALVLSPVLAAVALAIYRDSPGGVLYRQERLGHEGRIFTVLKFRTMYRDADEILGDLLAADPDLRAEYERFHKLENDPRVTPVGRFLRRYSLDELPQIFNVLRGEMSLVGPRAYMPAELPKMNRLGRAVLQVPPGVTGLWQVSGRNRLCFDERLDLDLHYVQNWSLWLDLYLLVRTIPTVFSGDGAS